MPTKDDVPPLSAEQAASFLRQIGDEHIVGPARVKIEAIASGQHIVIRNPISLIEQNKYLERDRKYVGSACAPGCYGRCKICPDDLIREQGDYITKLELLIAGKT